MRTDDTRTPQRPDEAGGDDGTLTQFLCFETGGQDYGFGILDIESIQAMPRLTPVPGVPDYVLGVMNLRGNIVPVMSLERRFGHDERRPADSYRVVIVLRERGPGSVRLAGVAVDAVTEVLDLPPDRLGAPPTRRGEARLDEDRVHGGEDLAMAAGFVEAVAMLDARLLVVLNTDATAFAAVPAMVTRSAIG